MKRLRPMTSSAVFSTSFIDITSGPPSSNSWFAAAGDSAASATTRPTSSMNTGCIACLPSPNIGMNGRKFVKPSSRFSAWSFGP